MQTTHMPVQLLWLPLLTGSKNFLCYIGRGVVLGLGAGCKVAPSTQRRAQVPCQAWVGQRVVLKHHGHHGLGNEFRLFLVSAATAPIGMVGHVAFWAACSTHGTGGGERYSICHYATERMVLWLVLLASQSQVGNKNNVGALCLALPMPVGIWVQNFRVWQIRKVVLRWE